MTHPRALSPEQEREAERWFTEYERIGTFAAKALELGVTKDTLRDSIRRVRGQDTRTLAKKLAAYSAALRASDAIGLTTDNSVQASRTGDVPRGSMQEHLLTDEEHIPTRKTG